MQEISVIWEVDITKLFHQAGDIFKSGYKWEKWEEKKVFWGVSEKWSLYIN